MQHLDTQQQAAFTETYEKESIDLPSIMYDAKRIHFKFLYVGSNQDIIQYLSKIFQSGWTAESVEEAQQYITDSDFYNQLIPDVIFIDTPVVRSEILSFHSFLKNEQHSLNTILIYHSLRLKKEDLQFLQHHRLIDDALEIGSQKIDYQKKILFLKRVKRTEGKVQNLPLRAKKKTVNPKRSSLIGKRLLDITFASIAILLLLPVMAFIALLLKLESKGPILYISKRAGKGFRVFDFYKFRSMVPDADKKVDALIRQNQYTVSTNGAMFFKVANDPRITKLGKFLRNSSLDEIPQLFNVLKGDMSLVGNRPLPIYEAITLTTNEFVERFAAPAGITGLWQIKKRGNSEMSAEERINLDINYSRNYNLLYDLKIMAYTPIALFQKTTV
jgi:lipopolysaccharide/colanic/teichoic acid biosynthesis glycosyltransferase